MDLRLIKLLAISLILTLVLESVFFLIFKRSNKRDYLLLCLVNILTNPPLVLFYWTFVIHTSINRTLIKFFLEFIVVVVEGFYYKKYGENFTRPFVFALGANIFSYTLVYLIQTII